MLSLTNGKHFQISNFEETADKMHALRFSKDYAPKAKALNAHGMKPQTPIEVPRYDKTPRYSKLKSPKTKPNELLKVPTAKAKFILSQKGFV